MTTNKSPLQAHFEHIFNLKTIIDGKSLNSHYLIGEHIKNINNAFQESLAYPATMYYHHQHLQELFQQGRLVESELFYELYKDKEYLKGRVPLCENEKLRFIQRVAARCKELDYGLAYNTIINELNSYLSFLLSLSPDITKQEIYAVYKDKMASSLLGRSFDLIKKILPEHEFGYYFDQLTQVPMFNRNDFSYILSEDEETVNG